MSDDLVTQLCIEDIAFERNYRRLFGGITAELNAGEILQVQGANGAGKSTLLRMLAGYIEPLHGKILWRSKSIFVARHGYQQQLHYLGHQNGLKPQLTVLENLRLSLALAAVKFDADLAHQTLAQLQIAQVARQPVYQLSAGQCRRAALARLLLKPCQLWILDEPTTALDAAGQQTLLAMLNQHCARGGMAILAAHQPLQLLNPPQVIALGERIV
jgi:heme exporter protein A